MISLLLLLVQPAAVPVDTAATTSVPANVSGADLQGADVKQADASATAGAGDQLAAKNKMVCRTLPPPIGTRIGKRKICKTQAQWNDEQAQIEQGMDKYQTRFPGRPGG